MHAALSIAAKDLRQKVRDRSAIILAVVAPLTLAFLFSTAIPADQTTLDATFVVVNLDRGPVAQGLVDGPLGGLAPFGIKVEQGTSEADARARIASQMPIAEKAKLAHHVIDNSGAREETERQVRAVYGALLDELAARLRA